MMSIEAGPTVMGRKWPGRCRTRSRPGWASARGGRVLAGGLNSIGPVPVPLVTLGSNPAAIACSPESFPDRPALPASRPASSLHHPGHGAHRIRHHDSLDMAQLGETDTPQTSITFPQRRHQGSNAGVGGALGALPSIASQRR